MTNNFATTLGAAELMALTVHGLQFSTAPTPAFNFHDHLMLAGAVTTAARAVSDENACTVEVGSFAGHTTQFQAALLQKLGLRGKAAMVHAVDASVRLFKTDWGLQKNILDGDPQLNRSIHLHLTTSQRMRPWHEPLRLFFEDSGHTYRSTRDSFTTFERSLVTGGVVVLHDVVCCAQSYPGLMKFMHEHILAQPTRYRELRFELPTSWHDVPPQVAKAARDALHASLDPRADYRQRALRKYGVKHLEPCSVLCNKSKGNLDPLEAGYQWSLCPNIRAFQRL
mmetsp:Transcript_45841/g.120214  ORF Transcript_45841/g.120214 Transcript_45841/m.120214 type:complete len:282 (-) Transcript_45841:570-1415(-)|eukprot:CAMPEP_0115870170 /NCGR_PEP_ID=MMETSP0287-20121206/22184_1 /TAXON_ID=412157 /ORGANISM="Chrysochromulina rotalis, Strain UIO044" /LENGTH=281 /DNA_ID=CAMNT_0003324875 /DNA_START=152 /DNA_END=997 /DNA_ORIENTATION=-